MGQRGNSVLPIRRLSTQHPLSLIRSFFVGGWLLFSVLIPTTGLLAQEAEDPFADPFAEESSPTPTLDDPFGDPFENSENDSATFPTDERPGSNPRGSIEFSPNGRLQIRGPGGVPELSIIPTLRLELLHTPEDLDNPIFTTRDSEIRLEGHILGRDSFLARLNLAGDHAHGVISELWFDTPLKYGFHLTTGRIPGTLGLESFPGQERRISISPGLVDWAGGGSAWGIRTGGRWIKGALTGDLQLMLDEPVDVDGEKFGGYGLLTRLSIRPLSRFLFGGPDGAQESWKDTSLFLTSRWDWEADGIFRIRSAGEQDLLQTIPLHHDNIRWVRTGWRLPLTSNLQFENEWLRCGFFGVGPADFDMPGEVTAFQLGLRAQLGSNNPLPIALPHDLPGKVFKEEVPSPSSGELASGELAEARNGYDLLLRYEQLTVKSGLSELGWLSTGAGSNDLEAVRLAVTRKMRPGLRWTLESAWTRSDVPILLSSGGSSAQNLFTFRCLVEIGL